MLARKALKRFMAWKRNKTHLALLVRLDEYADLVTDFIKARTE